MTFSQTEYLRQELLSQQWIQDLHWLPEIDSTNSWAYRSLQDGSAGRLPALFLADQQTAGRGRGDHRWWSPGGCLMMTLAIGADLLPGDRSVWSQLALVVGVAVAEAAGEFVDASTIQLKWPNDLYVAGRKCGGILIESGPHRADGTHPSTWLVGLGLNVDLNWSAAPEQLQAQATSLSDQSPARVDQAAVLVELIQQLEGWLLGWRDGQRHWQTHWHQACLLTGKVVRVGDGQSRGVVGLCEGVDGHGRLVVRTESGVQLMTSGQVIDWD